MKYNWKWSLGVVIFASQFALLCLGDASEILPIAFAKPNDLVRKESTIIAAHKIGSSAHKMRYLRNDYEESYKGAYSRPRSRHLVQDYIHVDYSDEFSYNGKMYISLMFLAFWVLSITCAERKAGISLLGAALMVALRHFLVQTGDGPQFQIERVLFWEPLIILLGLMLTTVGLDRTEHSGLVRKTGDMLDNPVPWKRCRNILFLSTAGSAVLSKDMIVFLFSGTVADLCIRHNVGDPMPYLLSLSTAANIGSAMTVTGTLSNLLVSTLAYDQISWPEFANNLLLPVASASIINFILIAMVYRSELFCKSTQSSDSEQVYEMVGTNDTDEERHEPSCEYAAADEEQREDWSAWSILQLVLVAVYVICFVAGMNVLLVSMGAGICMMIVFICNRIHYHGKSVVPQSEEVDGDQVSTTPVAFDYGILVTHLGQFIIVGSFNDTGVPQMALNWMLFSNCSEQITQGLCLYWFVGVVAGLSTIFSSASTIQMFAAILPYSSPYEWVQVSFAANMAENLALSRSSTHFMVGDQFARATGKSTPMTIRSFGLLGLVSGSLSLLVGAYLLANFHFVPECSERLGECF